MICGHGHDQKFKYLYSRESKIIQMPYPRAKVIDQIPALCPASPPPRRLDIDRCISVLPTIQVYPELDGRTLDIFHCFCNIAGHFSRWKVAFSALIKLQILHVHVLFSLAALFATRARARVVFTGSTFALLIFRRFRCFCNHFRHVF